MSDASNPRNDPNRPRFVLEPWDVHAPLLARMWAAIREAYVEAGLKPPTDLMSAEGARQRAYEMERWRHTHETVQVVSMAELNAAEALRQASGALD